MSEEHLAVTFLRYKGGDFNDQNKTIYKPTNSTALIITVPVKLLAPSFCNMFMLDLVWVLRLYPASDTPTKSFQFMG